MPELRAEGSAVGRREYWEPFETNVAHQADAAMTAHRPPVRMGRATLCRCRGVQLKLGSFAE